MTLNSAHKFIIISVYKFVIRPEYECKKKANMLVALRMEKKIFFVFEKKKKNKVMLK